MSVEDYKEKIREALKEYVKKDWQELMAVDAHEVTNAHRIAVYLESRFKGYNIDLEYNRDRENIKKLENLIRPDIIIHRRNSDDNLCIFEIKKSPKEADESENDVGKIKGEIGKYHYKLGVFLGILEDKIEICWIVGDDDTQTEEWEIMRREI